jgi:hypothetical protein
MKTCSKCGSQFDAFNGGRYCSSVCAEKDEGRPAGRPTSSRSLTSKHSSPDMPRRLGPDQGIFDMGCAIAGLDPARVNDPDVRGRVIALGDAWRKLAIKGVVGVPRFRLDAEGRTVARYRIPIRRLWQEYWKIVGDPPSIETGINRQRYQQAYYSKRRDEQKARLEGRLSDELQDWLKYERAVRIEFEESEIAVPDPTDDVIDSLDAKTLYEELLAQLTPAEKLGLTAILNREPVADEADKKRRQRARQKLKQYIEKGERNMDTPAQRTVERLASLERDVALIKEDLGLVSDRDAAEAVDRFLDSFEDESAA